MDLHRLSIETTKPPNGGSEDAERDCPQITQIYTDYLLRPPSPQMGDVKTQKEIVHRLHRLHRLILKIKKEIKKRFVH